MTLVQNIAHKGCGCEAVSNEGLMTIDMALAEIMRAARPIGGAETVALADAVGRVLSSPVRARGMVPPFANAAMDGFAINTFDLKGDGPWDLTVTTRLAAGEAPRSVLANGCAGQIFTGAPVPDGANAVVMQEHVQLTDDGIRILQSIDPGTHIRAAGEDLRAGKIALHRGSVLTAADIAVCAAAGHDTLSVYRPLRVALLVTGNEVRQPGDARGAAGIWDVNTPMLRTAVASPAVSVCQTNVAIDDKLGLQTQLAELAQSVDLIVTTGGISVGEEDHVKPALADLAATIAFSGVALKPGKPVSFGQLNGTYWLGLPGNPLSAFLTWHLFGKPLCRALTGAAPAVPSRRHVVLQRALHHKPGRCELRLAHLSGFDAMGREVADFPNATHSGRVASLSGMDGFLYIPDEAETLPKGTLVEFQTL